MASGLAEPLRFVLNGGFATAVHYCVLLVGLEVVALPSAGVANLIASTVGTAASFLGNRYFVFRSRNEPLLAQAVRFVGLYLSIALVNGAVLYVWTDRLSLDYHIGFVIAVVLQTMMGYLGGKRLVFLGDRTSTAVLKREPGSDGKL